jgi:hypothetical protein
VIFDFGDNKRKPQVEWPGLSIWEMGYPFDYCYPCGIFESPKSIDNIFISVKIEVILRIS